MLCAARYRETENVGHDKKSRMARNRRSVFSRVSERMSGAGGKAADKKPSRNIERALSYLQPLHSNISRDDPYLAGCQLLIHPHELK